MDCQPFIEYPLFSYFYLTEVQLASSVTVIPIEQFIKNSQTYSIASSICLDTTLIGFNEIEKRNLTSTTPPFH